jgi:hypothetical protein
MKCGVVNAGGAAAGEKYQIGALDKSIVVLIDILADGGYLGSYLQRFGISPSGETYLESAGFSVQWDIGKNTVPDSADDKAFVRDVSSVPADI